MVLVRVEVSSGCEWGREETAGTLSSKYALSRSGELRVLGKGQNGVSRTLGTTPRAELVSVLHQPGSAGLLPVLHGTALPVARRYPLLSTGRGICRLCQWPQPVVHYCVCNETFYEMGSRIRDRSQPQGSSSKKQKRKRQT